MERHCVEKLCMPLFTNFSRIDLNKVFDTFQNWPESSQTLSSSA